MLVSRTLISLKLRLPSLIMTQRRASQSNTKLKEKTIDKRTKGLKLKNQLKLKSGPLEDHASVRTGFEKSYQLTRGEREKEISTLI